MPLTDVDIVRRRYSVGLPSNAVDFILYSYNEYSFSEQYFQSVYELLKILKNEIENNTKTKDKYYWIEVINHSSVILPENIKILCEYFDIHPLTIEDITTLASYTKLDLFHDNGALYLLMKILKWNGQRVQQQQISFYLKRSQNLLITFQETCIEHIQPFFQTIRNRLRRQQYHKNEHIRLRQLNVDYLFYCLLDDIIDSYTFVMEEIASRIGEFDESLMLDTQSRTLITLHSIYRLQHDLLHLRILFNPLKEIITRLQRVTTDDHDLSFPRTDPSLKLGMKHHLHRRQAKTVRPPVVDNSKLTSIYLNEYIFVYLHDLNDHIDQLIDSLEIQRENVSILISFWITLHNNETEKILEILMLISVLFMPCTFLIGINSTNFKNQPQLEYHYGYYIILSLLVLILSGMIIWYRVKKWI